MYWASRRWCPVTGDQFACSAASSVDTSFTAVRAGVLKFMKEAEVVVMHDKGADLKALPIKEEELGGVCIRDTQEMYHPTRSLQDPIIALELRKPTKYEVKGMLLAYKQTETYSLHDLCRCVLGDIQKGPHDALEDAKATMKLYMWEQ